MPAYITNKTGNINKMKNGMIQIGLHRSASACDPSLAGVTFHGFLYMQPQDPLMDVRSCVAAPGHCTAPPPAPINTCPA